MYHAHFSWWKWKIISSVLCALNFTGSVYTKSVAKTNNLKRLKQQTGKISFTDL
jgi:hypothetical protein